jgi:Acyclic terpene utilisation family protein AtuA
MLGTGFRESSIVAALRDGARMIGCDSGTTDFGPHLLATGRSHFSRAAVRRDLELILVHGRAAGVPVVVGSAGGAGGDGNPAWLRNILLEIARDRSLHFRLALIRSEQPKQKVHDLLAAGRIEPLAPDGELSEEAIDSAAHIVAMMGVEPIQAGLAEADVVLAGRASDAAICAAMPLLGGFEPALCWHAGKILECGAAAVAQRAAPGSMMAMLQPDAFDIYPLREDCRCTPQSIASHTLYEHVDPFNLREPSGTLETQACTYEAISDRAVRVRGSRFAPAEVYRVKLEGARLAGYSTIIAGAIRDPLTLRQLDSWLEGLAGSLRERLANTVGTQAPYRIATRVYGRDGVMGEPEPRPRVEGHEVMILWEVLADSQELAHSVAASLSHMAVHYPIPEWHGLINGVAFPFAPSEVDRGPVYEFHVNCLARPDSPTELFPMEVLTV